MVNYCCVRGCKRNSANSKFIHFYTFPKERYRQIEWLQAIGRQDLLEKNVRLFHRVCSTHFSPRHIKTKHLTIDAAPTLFLTNNPIDVQEHNDSVEESTGHDHVICNSCNETIIGFRYKCIICSDYDLCSKCEKFEAHPEHCMLRIPKPMKFKMADDLTTKWRKFLETENSSSSQKVLTDDGSSDDDVPITRYLKQYHSGVDLSEDVKAKIRDEVMRVLSIKPDVKGKKILQQKYEPVKSAIDDYNETEKVVEVEKELVATLAAPEMAFADVNNVDTNQINVKNEDEMPTMLRHILFSDPDPGQPKMHIKLTDDYSVMIETKYE